MRSAKGKGATRKEKTEVTKTVEDKNVGKRKARKVGEKPVKKVKSDKKDPNKPKRPATAFFVFLEEFRKVYKEEHPNVKAVSAVGKAGGAKWKSMSEADKAPYEAKAGKRKVEYEKLMTVYNNKQESLNEDEEDSKAGVNNKDEDESEEDNDDDEEDDEDDD